MYPSRSDRRLEKMKLITSDNSWSCMAAAAAMVSGTSVAYITHMLGHDGSDHPWPAPYEHLHRGFHIHEIIDLFWLQFQQSLTPFVRKPTCQPHPDAPEIPARLPYSRDPEEWFQHVLLWNWGIITGIGKGLGHAVAWDGREVFDPRGYRYPYRLCAEHNFDPDTFWCLK